MATPTQSPAYISRAAQAAEHTLPEFRDPSREWRRLFAEGWGTFLLVLAGAGAKIVAATSGEVTPAMEAIAPGLTVMAAIYFLGTVSGAHLNPAVTLAFAARRNFPWARVPGYIAAQFTGGVLAVLLLWAILGKAGDLGATLPNGIDGIRACVLEAVLTAGLVNVILGTAASGRNIGANAALAIGGYIALAGLWAGPLTGASMNPARSLAPDIVRGEFGTSWIYVVGPLVGAMIAVGFEWILKGPPTRQGTRAAQGD